MATVAATLPKNAPKTHIPEKVRSNSDGELPDRVIVIGTAIDVFGIFRQMAAIVHAGASLAGRAAVVGFTGTCVSIALLATGIMSVVLALTDVIPDAHKQLFKVREELQETQAEIALKGPKEEKLGEVQKALSIVKLGMANQYLFLSMALGQIASAVTTMLESAHAVLGISKAATASASMVANCVLSGLYFLRGIVAFRRANKNLALIDEFKTGYLKAKEMGVQQTIDFIIDCERRFGANYLARRLDTDASCLGDKKASQYHTFEQKIEFLQLVEKAMYSQELKHKIARGIGVAMIIGAVLSIVAMQLTADPTALHIIEGVSAAFFLGVEVPFLINDNPAIFEKYRDWLYKIAESKMTPVVVSVEDQAHDNSWHKYQEVVQFHHASLPAAVHPREQGY